MCQTSDVPYRTWSLDAAWTADTASGPVDSTHSSSTQYYLVPEFAPALGGLRDAVSPFTVIERKHTGMNGDILTRASVRGHIALMVDEYGSHRHFSGVSVLLNDIKGSKTAAKVKN